MRTNDSAIPPELMAELAALAAMSDNTIDTSDIPEKLDWSNARRGVVHAAMREHEATLRLDDDVVEWFKAHSAEGESHQAAINRTLREAMARADRDAA